MSILKGRNSGHKYEDKIKELLNSLDLLPNDLQNNDAGFIHRGKSYFLEIKSKKTSDYGASKIIWDSTNKEWEWNKLDRVAVMLDEINVLHYINKNFIPYKHSIADIEIDDPRKKSDQNHFERKIEMFNDASFIHRYYAFKNCFYIQVEGKGFYFLMKDIAGLGVPQYSPQLNFIRLRAKTHKSKPIYDYSFRAEIQAKRNSITVSPYNLENTFVKFPPIVK